MRFSKSNFLPVILIFFLALSFQPDLVYAQKKKKEKEPKGYHSPHKATLWSLLPGAGQIYNKKYWKLPIVYAGFAVTGYFVVTNRQEYLKFSNAYICDVNATEEEPCEDPLSVKYSSSDLQTIRDGYRRNLELSIIFMGLWYILQMLDATVDAHLHHWNVNDDISVQIKPVIQPIRISNDLPAHNGLRIAVNF